MTGHTEHFSVFIYAEVHTESETESEPANTPPTARGLNGDLEAKHRHAVQLEGGWRINASNQGENVSVLIFTHT